jgi:hypothetical protein
MSAEAVIAYQKLKYDAVQGENIRNHNTAATRREERIRGTGEGGDMVKG